jgi:hypothetical protein
MHLVAIRAQVCAATGAPLPLHSQQLRAETSAGLSRVPPRQGLCTSCLAKLDSLE